MQGGFDFRSLVVDLFSSPLVTAAAHAATHDTRPIVTSISRVEHLCHGLNQRLGVNNACPNNQAIVDGFPADEWARGNSSPLQTTDPSLFHAATLEAFCEDLARRLVDAEGSPLQTSDMDGALRVLVERLMDVNPQDERHAVLLGALEDHVQAAAELTGNARRQLRSAFALACTSPFVAAVGL